MTIGLILIITGILGFVFNTIALISFFFKMKRINEIAFITGRGTVEPRTSILLQKDIEFLEKNRQRYLECDKINEEENENENSKYLDG